MAMDPKVRNLIIWIVQSLAMIGLGGYLWLKYVSSEPFQALGQLVVLIAIWRSLLTFYRRCIIPPKHPRQYGKWAVVTGCTDGIGKAYVDYLAEEGMNILLISRSEDKLKDQMKALQELHGEKDADGVARFKYMAYDFTTTGSDCDAFFAKIEAVFEDFGKIGSLGVLINNVGITNAHPMKLEEFDDGFVQDILTVNVLSTIRMSRLAHRVMLAKGNGAVISVSSGSGNHPTPQLAVYSSTKALITQFSRSMHVECWDTGVDFLVVTPYYIVSNLFKRKSGTLVAPMATALVRGTFAQLGKQYIWQGHGYWFHGFMANIAQYWWGSTARWNKMMKDNRARYDKRQQEKAAAGKTE